jgi:hypothetical protein
MLVHVRKGLAWKGPVTQSYVRLGHVRSVYDRLGHVRPVVIY